MLISIFVCLCVNVPLLQRYSVPPHTVQVLHHVSDISKVIKECYRILRPRGALIVNTASPEQMVDTIWFLYLIPAACERLKNSNRSYI